LTDALCFEFSKVALKDVRSRMVGLLAVPDTPVPPNPTDPGNSVVPSTRGLETGRALDEGFDEKGVSVERGHE